MKFLLGKRKASISLTFFLSSTLLFVYTLQLFKSLITHLSYNFELQYGAPPYAGIIIMGMLLLSIIGNPLGKILNNQKFVIICFIVIGLSRLTIQLTQKPMLELGMSAIGVICFIWVFPNVLKRISVEDRFYFGASFIIGTSIETSIHGLLGTYNLTWVQSTTANDLVLISFLTLSISLIIASPKFARQFPYSNELTIFVWWFIVLVNGIIFQNIATISSASGLSINGTITVLTIGNLMSILLIPAIYKHLSIIDRKLILVAGLLFVILTIVFPKNSLLILVVWYGQVFLVASVLLFFCSAQVNSMDLRPFKEKISISIGFVGFCIFIVLYYLSYLLPFPLDNGYIPPLASSIIVMSMLIVSRNLSTQNIATITGKVDFNILRFIIVLTSIIPVAFMFVDKELPIAAQTNSNKETSPERIRVMTYNLHNGFSFFGQPSINEAIEVITLNNPDVIFLQEVSRGWYINGSFDMLSWLEQELPIYSHQIFIPTADFQWGMLLMSKYPISDHEIINLPVDLPVMQRKFLWAEIELGQEKFPIIATHLHHLPDSAGDDTQSQKRLAQAEQILTYASNNQTYVIMGDMNSGQNSVVNQLFFDKGWVSSQSKIGNGLGNTTIFSEYINPEKLDWIYIQPNLNLSEISIINSYASDHLSLAVSIKLP